MNWQEFVHTFIGQMGFENYRVEVDPETRHGLVVIEDALLTKDQTALFIEHLNYVLQLIARHKEESPVFFDINHYRRERETLITQLARAAAQKVLATKTPLSLPPMNSYERRLVHLALAHHPEVATESSGLGKTRFVIVKPLTEEQK